MQVPPTNDSNNNDNIVDDDTIKQDYTIKFTPCMEPSWYVILYDLSSTARKSGTTEKEKLSKHFCIISSDVMHRLFIKNKS